MRARAPMLLSLALLVAPLLTACQQDRSPDAADGAGSVASTWPAPTPGARLPALHPTPATAMDRLEAPVARRLAGRLAEDGLRLEYLECPRWDRTVPSRMRCRGYVNGLLARVMVDLHRSGPGRAVGFDAEMTAGVIATRSLHRTLDDQRWQHADCGPHPAYPATVGLTIVCRAERDGAERYLVVTVRSTTGAVAVSPYQGAHQLR
ncbi:MAG: hypothetical protein WB441_09225 [Nocardioidaceae bacterium]